MGKTFAEHLKKEHSPMTAEMKAGDDKTINTKHMLKFTTVACEAPLLMWPKIIQVHTNSNKARQGGGYFNIMLYVEREKDGLTSVVARRITPKGVFRNARYKLMFKKGRNSRTKLLWPSALYSIAHEKGYERANAVGLKMGPELSKSFVYNAEEWKK